MGHSRDVCMYINYIVTNDGNVLQNVCVQRQPTKKMRALTRRSTGGDERTQSESAPAKKKKNGGQIARGRHAYAFNIWRCETVQNVKTGLTGTLYERLENVS